jgi:serine/threonine-protein kinase
MGAVFEGRHVSLGKPVAIKVLDSRIGGNRSVARFLREGKLLAQLRHPHVVSILDVGEEKGLPFLVMELLEGETLASHVQRAGPLSPAGVADLLLPVASAVSAAHEMGIIHRDLKPENIMLARRRHGQIDPVVLDFGISKELGDDAADGLTHSGAVLGSVHYMAPELTRNAKLASDLSDVYALGAVLYACATGRPPVTGESVYEIMHAVATAPVRAPSSLNDALPREFDALVLRAMAREPSARFDSVASLGSALLPFASAKARLAWSSEFGGEDADPADPFAITVGNAKKRRRLPWIAALAMAATVGAAALVRAPHASPEAPVAASAPPTKEAPSASMLPRAVAIPPPREPLALVAPPPSASGSNQEHRRVRPAPRPTAPRLSAPNAAASSPPSSAPREEYGTNGAPIFE